MNTKSMKTSLSLAAALGALAMPAQAAVTFLSSLQNDSLSEISNWSSTGTSKSSDLDGNNFYGSDGYTWMNNSGGGGAEAVLYSPIESGPSYTSGIAYTGSGTGVSGSYFAADDRLDSSGAGAVNVGYAGVNHNGTTGATTLQELFAYTMNRDMADGETIRLGVVLDSLADGVVGADALRIVAGGTADATGLNRSGVMDMYFFDITGLSSGEEIQIWGSKATNTDGGYNAITIGGVTLTRLTFLSHPPPSCSALVDSH